MVEYKLRDSKRGWWNTRSLYSDEGALEAPSRNNAIIENDLDLVLSSTVNRKLEVHQECDPFLKLQGKGSILTDAFNHWFQGEKEYNIKPDKYWWHYLLQKIDNHLLQFVTNGNTGYSYLAAQATIDVLNKLYKTYGDSLTDKIDEFNDSIQLGKEAPNLDFKESMEKAANSAKNKIRKNIENVEKVSKNAGKGTSTNTLDLMDLLSDPRLSRLVNVKENNIRDFLKTTIDRATESVTGKADIREESLFDSDDIEDLVNVENFAHLALFEDLTTRYKKYHVSFDIYIDDSGSMDSRINMDGVSTTYRDLARMLAYKLKNMDILRDCYLFSDFNNIAKISHDHIFSAHIGGGTDIAQCIRRAKKAKRPTIIVTDGWDSIKPEDYDENVFILVLECPSMHASFVRFVKTKQLIFFGRNGFGKPVMRETDQWGEKHKHIEAVYN